MHARPVGKQDRQFNLCNMTHTNLSNNAVRNTNTNKTEAKAEKLFFFLRFEPGIVLVNY